MVSKLFPKGGILEDCAKQAQWRTKVDYLNLTINYTHFLLINEKKIINVRINYENKL